METINSWIGTPPAGMEGLGYLVNATFVLAIISEVISLFKYIAAESLKIGKL